MREAIFIYHDSKQEGPYTPEQIELLVNQGLVSPIELGCKEGMTSWVPLNTILQTINRVSSSVPPTVFQSSAPSNVVPVPRAKSNALQGVGGWLLFFCIILTIISPLLTISQLASGWQEVKPVFNKFPSIKTAMIWESIGILALGVYGFIVGCIIWNGSLKGRVIAKGFLLVRLLGFIAIEILAFAILSDLPPEIIIEAVRYYFYAVLREIVFFSIWWLYFQKSKRVKNTYVIDQ